MVTGEFIVRRDIYTFEYRGLGCKSFLKDFDSEIVASQWKKNIVCENGYLTVTEFTLTNRFNGIYLLELFDHLTKERNF